jgi:hypothetical protein
MNASQYNLSLPMGQLSLLADGNALAKIRTSIRNRDKTLAAVNSLSNLDSYRFWLSSKVERDKDDLNLFYSEPAAEVFPLRQLIPHWRDDAALNLSRAIDMARHVLRAIGELENLQPFHFLVSPGQVFFVRDAVGKERWITLPLPIDDVAVADFLRADEECWRWFSADELLGAVQDDRAYTVGAALYLCSIGELFPNEISRAERIRRVLSYRAGNPVFAQSILRSAMPKALATRAGQLCDFIMLLLGPSLGRPLTMAQVSRQLDHFQEELSPYRLACHWEEENDITRALKSLEYFVAAVPESEVPWDMVERLRRKAGDFAGAAEAAARTIRSIPLITRLQDLIAAGDDRRQELEQLVLTAKEKIASQSNSSNEEDYLYLAYTNGRWLKHSDQTLSWLGEHNFSVSWFKAVSCLLKSRLFADKANWIEVIRNCRNGRQIIAKMPDTGGRLGRYADAYFELLEGIANICEVYERNYSQEFLNDAFRHLNNAWLNQQLAETQDLNEAITDWLCWLDKFSSNNPKLTMLGLGIDALLCALGADLSRKNYTEVPDIPWFDESRIFIRRID